MGKRLTVIRVWQNGVQTSNPVELGHWIMRQVATDNSRPLKTKHVLKQQSWITDEWLSELERCMGPSHWKTVRIVQKVGFHKVCAHWIHEHYQKTTRCKECLVHSHSSNNMPFIVIISSNTLSLETRQNEQVWSENISGPWDRKNSRWVNPLAKWWLWCFWTARVYCWWISWKRAQQSMHHHTVQPKNGYKQPLNNNAPDCAQQVFCFFTITLGPKSWLQHNNPCSTSCGQSLNSHHTAQILCQVTFTSFPLLRLILLATNFASDDNVKTIVTRWLKSQGTEFYEASINKLVPWLDKCLNLGKTVLKNKVISIDNTCYLFS